MVKHAKHPPSQIVPHEVSIKVSTTQIAGVITLVLTVYNMLAQNIIELDTFAANPEQMLALAGLLAPLVTTVYMMWRRVKKTSLRWGFLK